MEFLVYDEVLKNLEPKLRDIKTHLTASKLFCHSTSCMPILGLARVKNFE